MRVIFRRRVKKKGNFNRGKNRRRTKRTTSTVTSFIYIYIYNLYTYILGVKSRIRAASCRPTSPHYKSFQNPSESSCSVGFCIDRNFFSLSLRRPPAPSSFTWVLQCTFILISARMFSLSTNKINKRPTRWCGIRRRRRAWSRPSGVWGARDE